MRRTSLEVDEQQLARAQQVLGTSGVKDTVELALQEVIRAALRRRLAARIRSGEGIDRGEQMFEASRSWHR
ncbi:MAG: type II toxin-antitoxin system VapB family antitoxin [Spirochaetaceae bacterium]|nr:type II toxin-antitoxin system VapB family antitoxin [Spirochaetaceae bacterium]